MDKNHILIVEDDADIRSGIEIYLKNQGYDVSQAGDGIEGLAVIEKEEIDLAIVDIMMPRMDGITMMMKVREKGYDFPVIMLSAKSDKLKQQDVLMSTGIIENPEAPADSQHYKMKRLKQSSGTLLPTLGITFEY